MWSSKKDWSLFDVGAWKIWCLVNSAQRDKNALKQRYDNQANSRDNTQRGGREIRRRVYIIHWFLFLLMVINVKREEGGFTVHSNQFMWEMFEGGGFCSGTITLVCRGDANPKPPYLVLQVEGHGLNFHMFLCRTATLSKDLSSETRWSRSRSNWTMGVGLFPSIICGIFRLLDYLHHTREKRKMVHWTKRAEVTHQENVNMNGLQSGRVNPL